MTKKVWVAIAACGAALMLYFTVLMIADGQVTRLLPRAIAEGVGGRDADRYSVTVGEVRLSPFLTGITVRDLVVSADTAAAASEPALVRNASLESLRVSGLRLIPLLRGKGIFVSAIEIRGPKFALDFAAAEGMEGDSARTDSPEEVLGSSSALPEATLERVTIRNGSIDVTRPTEVGSLTSYLRDLDLELTEIRVDTVTLADPLRALANSHVSLAFDTVYHVVDDSLYIVTARDFRADSRDSVLHLGKMEFTPTLDALPFFGRLPQRADRLNISAGPIRIQGLDFADYVREEALRIRRIDVDSLDLHVYSDIALDWGPKARPCRYHMGFADIPVPFRIDSVAATQGSIRYSELAKGSQSPGELTLEGVDVLLTNLTNDPNRMGASTPAVIQMSARLFGEGEMAATIRYPLLSPTLDFDIEAALGPMSLGPANRFATNVTGVVVKKGELDTLWVGLESRGGKATGRIDMRYRDLDIRVVDRNTGKEMAWHSVLGFLGNVALRRNNPNKPGEQPREGEIDYTCAADDIVFFEYFVGSLVSGIKRIVLIL